MTDNNIKQITFAVPGEWVIQKLLGPAFDEIGNDLKELYSVGKDKILTVAIRKSNINDNKRANLRVARDVFWNGSFTDDSICAEYFGGILASSRSNDGKDDSGIYSTDIIKSLSSNQLKLHYMIYHSINKLWLTMPSEKERPNVGIDSNLAQFIIWFFTKELEKFDISIEKDLIALHNNGLVGMRFESQYHKLENEKVVHYTMITPSTLGIQLYAVAHNKLLDWRKLPIDDFGEFPDIKTPDFFAFSIEELLVKTGLKKHEKS